MTARTAVEERAEARGLVRRRTTGMDGVMTKSDSRRERTEGEDGAAAAARWFQRWGFRHAVATQELR